MKMKRLGRTGLMVTENSFGALPIQRRSAEDATRILQLAYEEGINFYDTARFYTDSETKLGQALSPVRGNILLATKSMNASRQGLLDELETSLRELKTDYVDLFQLHNIPELPDPGDKEGRYYGLLQAREQGKARFIGITTHRIGVALEAARCGLYDTVQFPINYLASEEDLSLIEVCRQNDVGLIAMKGMSGGLISSARAAFAFMGQYDNVVPIWGIQRSEELREFMSFAREGAVMDDALRAVIAADNESLRGGFCRGCGYCMPCPAGIDIASTARMELMLGRAPWQAYTTPTWIETVKRAEGCTQCGACSSKCPYQLDTPGLVRDNYQFFMAFCKEKALI